MRVVACDSALNVVRLRHGAGRSSGIARLVASGSASELRKDDSSSSSTAVRLLNGEGMQSLSLSSDAAVQQTATVNASSSDAVLNLTGGNTGIGEQVPHFPTQSSLEKEDIGETSYTDKFSRCKMVVRYAVDSTVEDDCVAVPLAWMPHMPRDVEVHFVDDQLQPSVLSELRLCVLGRQPFWPITGADLAGQLEGAAVASGSLLTAVVYGDFFVLRVQTDAFGVIGRDTALIIEKAVNYTAATPEIKRPANPFLDEDVQPAVDKLVKHLRHTERMRCVLPPTIADAGVCVTDATPKAEQRIVSALEERCAVLRPPLRLLIQDPDLAETPRERTEREECFKSWLGRSATPGSVVYVSAGRARSPALLSRILSAVAESDAVLLLFGHSLPRLKAVELGAAYSVSHAMAHVVNTDVRGMSPEDSVRAIRLAGRLSRGSGPSSRVLEPSAAERRAGWGLIAGRSSLVARFRSLVAAACLSAPESAGALRKALPPVRGILLEGPSGCGKTLLVRALAASGEVPVLVADAAGVLGRHLGDSEAGLRAVFARARAMRPAVVLLENIEFAGGRRSASGGDTTGVGARLLSTLLNEMDGVGHAAAAGNAGVLVVATTTAQEMLDDALLRPGRLDVHMHVGLPDLSDRTAILRAPSPRRADDATLDALAAATEGLSCADVVGLVAMSSFRGVPLSDVLSALQ